MLLACIDFSDTSFALNLNFDWLELVLERCQSQSAMLALSPAEDLAVVATEVRTVATTSDVTHMPHGDVLYKHR